MGNHVHKLLQIRRYISHYVLCVISTLKIQPQNIHILISDIREVQNRHNCSGFATDLHAVTTKLEELLTSFASCHNGYNCSDVSFK